MILAGTECRTDKQTIAPWNQIRRSLMNQKGLIASYLFLQFGGRVEHVLERPFPPRGWASIHRNDKSATLHLLLFLVITFYSKVEEC